MPPSVLPVPDARGSEPAGEQRPPSLSALSSPPAPSASRNPPPRPEHDLGAELLAELAAAQQPGIALIYRALDDVVEHFGLTDAAVVVEDPGLGRQVFRVGRQPLEDDGELLDAGTGLYTDPPLGPDDIDDVLITNLCGLALRLDLLRYDAWHDPLTGLYDRRSFDRLLENAIARSRRYGWSFTLVLLDLDAFKALNDRQGHAAGDEALRALAERFRRVLRFGDDAARIGGDEFGLILPDTDPAHVPGLLDRVRDTDDRRHCPSFSHGLAVCPSEADDFDRLFRLADERLYEAKKHRSE